MTLYLKPVKKMAHGSKMPQREYIIRYHKEFRALDDTSDNISSTC